MAQWYGLGYTSKEIAEAFVKMRQDSYGYVFSIRENQMQNCPINSQAEVIATKTSGRNSEEVSNNFTRHFQGFVDGYETARST